MLAERTTTPREPELSFGDDLFESLEEDFDFMGVLHDELDVILAQDDSGKPIKTFEQIKTEAKQFFSNPLVAADMRAMESLAVRFADFCSAHGHGVDALDINFFMPKNHDITDDHDHTSDQEHNQEKIKKKSKEAHRRNETPRAVGWIVAKSTGLFDTLLNYLRGQKR